MKQIISLLALLFFIGCKTPSLPDDDATKVRGRYIVTAYVVAKDTLYSMRPTSTGYMPGINKLGIETFAVTIDRVTANQVSINTSYFRNGARSTLTKEATITQLPYQYKFSLDNSSSATAYEGTVRATEEKLFYERTISGGLYIPAASSTTPTSQTTSQEVVIIAIPQQ